MKPRKYYAMVHEKSLESFTEEVTSYLNTGWQLYGQPMIGEALVWDEDAENFVMSQGYFQAVISEN